MKKKRSKSPRRQLAERLYKDPRSDTFLKKGKSLIKAGYKESTALDRSADLLGSINFTDADYAVFRTFIKLVPRIDVLMSKKMDKMDQSGDISAKDFANLINLLERIAKLSGLMKNVVDKRVQIVNVGIPRQKCPECGHVMDYLKE